MARNPALVVLQRVVAASKQWPSRRAWWKISGVLALTALTVTPLGLRSGFLVVNPVTDLGIVLKGCAIAALAPGLTEELIFRAALLPHRCVPSDRRAWYKGCLYFCRRSLLSLAAYVLMHLVNPHQQSREVFWDVRFLGLCTLLGVACTAAYRMSGGSLWAAAFTHWLPVCVWLFYFGGYQKLHGISMLI